MGRNIFDPRGYAVAAKAFTHSGTRYELGDHFPHEELGCIEFELKGLWLADLIDFQPRPAQVAAPEAPPVKPKREKAPASTPRAE